MQFFDPRTTYATNDYQLSGIVTGFMQELSAVHSQLNQVTQQNEQLLKQHEQLLAQHDQILAQLQSMRNANTVSSSDASIPSSQCIKEKTVYVFRTSSAQSNFPKFEEQLQLKLNEMLPVKEYKKWPLLPSKQYKEVAIVKPCKTLDSIPQNADLVVVCCFSERNRIEASEIAPFFELLRNQGHKAACVSFRYGGLSVPAEISQQGNEIITASVHFNHDGMIDSTLTNNGIQTLINTMHQDN